jgi:hypothetical protein
VHPALVHRRHAQQPALTGGLVARGQRVVARRGHHDHPGVERAVDRLVEPLGRGAAAQREVDHVGALGDGLVDARDHVGVLALAPRVEHPDREHLGPRSDPEHADAVAGVGDHGPGHVRAVALAVLPERPRRSIRDVLRVLVVVHVVVSGHQPALEVGVAEVGAGVEHRHRGAAAGGHAMRPRCLDHAHAPQVGAHGIALAHRRGGSHEQGHEGCQQAPAPHHERV